MQIFCYLLMVVLFNQFQLISSNVIHPYRDSCSCEQILTAYDCNQNKNLFWKEGCQFISRDNVSKSLFCSRLSENNCNKIIGCAYYNDTCQHFSGCTAYEKQNTPSCQAISKQCYSDGFQCQSVKDCTEYKTKYECQDNLHNQGESKCRWNYQCQNPSCNEAPSTLTTDQQCYLKQRDLYGWLKGCITKGKGCSDKLKLCSEYSSSTEKCDDLIGLDGQCEGKDGEIFCSLIQPCSKFKGTLDCNKISECFWDSDQNVCRIRKCSEAPITANTDLMCQQYGQYCVTNGKGCTTGSRAPCFSYKGTKKSCEGFIGSDGKCKGISQEEDKECVPKPCQDAPIIYRQDFVCQEFQYGCISNGRGCTDQLVPCDKLFGTKSVCSEYIGSDGKCQGLSENEDYCVLESCENIVGSQTNTTCSSLNKNCVASTFGCIDKKSCRNTELQISCEGTIGCDWKYMCIADTRCSDFQSISVCKTNNIGIRCYWDGFICRNLLCTDAPIQLTTDFECNKFLNSCITNRQGCVSRETDCKQLKGTQQICNSYSTNIKCYNSIIAKEYSFCQIKKCSDDTTSITDEFCEHFLSGCRTMGQGCIHSSEPCSSYKGSQFICQKFIGLNGIQRCWNDSISNNDDSCRAKICKDLNFAKNNQECESFLSGCIFNGYTCIDKEAPCASYYGTSSECSQFRGNEGSTLCWSNRSYQGNCKDKECSDAPNTYTTNQQCQEFLAECLTTGFGCIKNTEPCSSYNGTITNCLTFTGNGIKCTRYDSCQDGQSCSEILSNDDCMNYSQSCRYLNGQCILAAQCTSYVASDLETCKNILDNSDQLCWWDGGVTCIQRNCQNAPNSVSSQQNCDDHLSGCVYLGGNKCQSKSSCREYTVSNNTLCQNIQDYQGNYCWAHTYSTCTDRTCSNCPNPLDQQQCDIHKLGCIYSNSKCLELNNCQNYQVQGTEQQKLKICKSLFDPQQKKCYWISGDSCTNLECQNAVAPQSQWSCDDLIKGQCEFVIKCQLKTCNSAMQKLSFEDCNEWMEGCQWDGNTSCFDQVDDCNQILLNQEAKLSLKQYLCENIQLKNPTKKCQFNSITQQCENRSCLYNTISKSNFECQKWKNDCNWNGNSGCFEQPIFCTDATALGQDYESKQQYCEDIKVLIKDDCTYQSGNNCVEKCQTAVNKINQEACNQFYTNCQWDGKDSCQAQVSECRQINMKRTENLNDLILLCRNTVLKGKQSPTCGLITLIGCRDRECIQLQKAYSHSDCENYLQGCQWNGINGCIDQQSDCKSILVENVTVHKQIYCQSIRTIIGYPCIYKSGNTCTDLCQGASGMTNFDDCNLYYQGCQYDGGESCMVLVESCEQVNLQQSYPINKKLICENIKLASSFQQCQYNSKLDKCENRTCIYNIEAINIEECQLWQSNCIWNGQQGCLSQYADCESVNLSNIKAEKKQEYCKQMNPLSQFKCQLNQDLSGCIKSNPCHNKVNASSQSDCNNWNKNCYFNGSDVCAEKKEHCRDYIIKNQSCNGLVDLSNKQCTNEIQRCQDRTCENAIHVYNNYDCENWKQYCKYVGYGCSEIVSCSEYKINSSDDMNRQYICQNLGCGYIQGSKTCTEQNCNTVSHKHNYWISNCQWDGIENIIISTSCSQYLIPSNIQQKLNYCSNLKDKSNNQCIYSDMNPISCTDKTCDLYTNTPKSEQDCQNYHSSCHISYHEIPICLSQDTPCQKFMGSPQQCRSFIGNGIKCWESNLTEDPQYCDNMQCHHNTWATSDEQCNEFMAGCKLNGTGCVKDIYSCNQLQGTNQMCMTFKGTDNKSLCKQGIQSYGQCSNRKCSDDKLSTTDSECKSYLPNCLTKGIGCIDQNQPCSAYSGTAQECKRFTGNGKKCWGETQCRDRKCTDDTSSSTDYQCREFLEHCVTKGKGCIDESYPCSSYQGSMETCQQFKGYSGSIHCWNYENYSQNSSCIEKRCIHNKTAISDIECEVFLPRNKGALLPKCVTNGSGCVNYPIKCSQFSGNQEQCINFTAEDGPCKSSGQGYCTPKICEEAPISYDNDTICKSYHPTCITNGKGCTDSRECSEFQTLNTCQNAGCRWSGNCIDHQNECSQLTVYGRYVCENYKVNTKYGRCFWNNSVCKDVQKCQDLSKFLNTHEQCSSIVSICTTTGNGCIEIGECSSYQSEQICQISRDRKCIWNKNSQLCRELTCTDFQYQSDQECNNGLEGCLSNGIFCISKKLNKFECKDLLSNQSCIQDANSNPCLWVDGSCYFYTKCENIIRNTHQDCQKVSRLCTTDGIKCIPFDFCERYNSKLSCVKGINGNCGWLTDQQVCQQFISCSQAKYYNNDKCQQYSSICITNGTTCIEKNLCYKYFTKTACLNDGICIYEKGKCRQRRCDDATNIITTNHQSCYAFQAKTKCTTDGVNCIEIQKCEQYKSNQHSCVIGSDGQCLFDIDKNNNGYCRRMMCEDFQLTSQVECTNLLMNCITNGTHCIQKNVCSNYTNEITCNNGGTDGNCVYWQGKCKLMNECSDANEDEMLCNLFKENCIYQSKLEDGKKKFSCQTKCTTIVKKNPCFYGESCVECPATRNIDKLSYNICVESGIECIPGDGHTKDQSTCYRDSLGTYRYNPKLNKCQACFGRQEDLEKKEEVEVPQSKINQQCFLGSNLLIIGVIMTLLD